MRKIYIFFLILISFFSKAQVTDAFKNQVEYTFRYINRNKVTTGLLSDYGLFFTNIEKFTGIRSDSNYLDFSEWQLLYTSIYSSRFNNVAVMQEPAVIYDQVESASLANNSSIVLSGLHYKYERFRDDATSGGYIVTDNGSKTLYEVPGRPSPYVIREVFALVPKRSYLKGANHQFMFKPELFYSNTGKTISTVQADFGDGGGWRTLAPNAPGYASYATEGIKTVVFRVNYSDGSFKESHTKISVSEIITQQNPSTRYGGVNIQEFQFPRPLFQAPKSYLGETAGALVTVEYSNPEREIRNPLIVIEGFDAWHILSPDDVDRNFSFGDLISTDVINEGINVIINPVTGQTLSAALEAANYDLIFIDFDDGTDYIQRNAYLVENVIEWVNSVKKPLNGQMQKNVVIGFSMGGLVARYALRDMELTGKVHDTRLYASIDSPHQGANVPIGFQAMVSHLHGVGISFSPPNVPNPGTLTFGHLAPDLTRAYWLLNSPAARQMLIYNVVGSGSNLSYNNSMHLTFMNEYRQMGYPSQGGIRNIVLASGSECATDQGFSYTEPFMNVNQKIKLSEFERFLVNVFGFNAIATNYPQAALATAFTTKVDIKMEFYVAPIAPMSVPVYKGKITLRKKILFVIDLNVVLFQKDFNSYSSFLMVDNAPGGVYDIQKIAEELPAGANITRFCFIPTYSALDIGGGNQTINDADVIRPYSPSSPPSAPKQVVAHNFFTNPSEAGVTNEIHTQLTQRNATWLFQEIQGQPAMFSCSYLCAGSSPTINGPNDICYNNSSPFVLSESLQGFNVTWQATPSNFFVTSSGVGTSATLKPHQYSAYGQAAITFTIRGPNSECDPLTVAHTFRVANPPAEPLITIADVYSWNSLSAEVNTIETGLYKWFLDDELIYTGYNKNEYVPLPSGISCGDHLLGVEVANSCGTARSDDRPEHHFNVECGFSMMAYPNPADDELIVSFESDTLSASTPSAEKDLEFFVEVTLHNKSQEKIYEIQTKKSIVKIPVKRLPEDVYILNVLFKESTIQRQVVIKHKN